ncbi:MAG: heparan-alpha-glucosaminide N-acetyltransferase domain-containing protein [Ilumatobacteraceae bacterium]|nr:MAG: DUF1624 domain-containing protein [Actinomycetota bacterium]
MSSAIGADALAAEAPEATAPAEPVPPDPPRTRSLYIDAARGLLLAVMLVTPAFGEGDAYPWLHHSPWDGLTVSDFVFPAFMFLSGFSLWFLTRRGFSAKVVRRLVKRVIALIVAGLVYNAWDTGADLTNLRFTGVLQTIGIAGGLGAIVIWATRGRRLPVAAVTAVIVMGWGVLVGRPCEGRCSPMFWLDRAIVNDQHLYRGAASGIDPEGVGQMLIAVALVLLGWIAATLLEGERNLLRTWLYAAGLGAAGLIAMTVVDPNKRLATPSYVAITAAAALTLLLVCRALEHLPVGKQLCWTASVLGINSLVVYMGERFVNGALQHTTVDGRPAHEWLADVLNASPDRAGLAIGFSVLVALWLVTAAMKALQWRIAL